uniref:BHLH domain-containing protein n=1 Tax=Aegilops tauschii subsp. strangulata TaxID=200361 RepID=A0A452ZB91_AEGTS
DAVQGDQASIIGGAIEFIRELEQLIQCLESQKRRRLYGDTPRPVADASAPVVPAASVHEPPPPPQGHEAPPFYVSPSLSFPGAGNGDGAAGAKVMIDLDACGGGLREEVAENKSSLADIEVRVLGEDAVIKVLSRRRPEQLIKTIAVLEEMHMSILHTNITTIEQ